MIFFVRKMTSVWFGYCLCGIFGQFFYECLLVRIQIFSDNFVTNWKQTMLLSYLPITMSWQKPQAWVFQLYKCTLNLFSLAFSISYVFYYSYVFLLYLISLFTQSVKMGRDFFYRRHFGIIHLVRSQNFPKNKHFLPPDTHTYVCASGAKYWKFFRKTLQMY